MSVNVKKDLPNSRYGKQEGLQVVVFADEFIDDLRPAEKVYPSILLPIVTLPILDYLIETLVRSRVQQVFLCYSSYVEKFKAHIASLKHVQDKNIIITPIFSDGCRSLGEALRDIYTKGCIRDDFILIRGTVFTNIDLRVLMDLHRARKDKDKNVALTMVFRNLGNITDSNLNDESTLVVSTANTRRILHYSPFNIHDKRIKLELQWFLDHDSVRLNTALLDTRIYLCSQSVLPLFADNFDFQTMEDFIRGVLINEELLESRIYWEPLIYSNYALPISSWKAYETVSTDILQRHSYPLVPDTLPLSLRNFIYLSNCMYKHSSSITTKTSVHRTESLIGEGSTLGEGSVIEKSIVGPNCTIGKNCSIWRSYIVSDVIVEDNSAVCNSFIFPNCTLTKHSVIISCIILPNVRSPIKHSNVLVDVDEQSNLVYNERQVLTNSDKTIETNYDSTFATLLILKDRLIDRQSSSFTSPFSSLRSSPILRNSPSSPVLQDDNEMFLSEVIDSLLRGYQDKLKCENLILEINSSRYAYNVSISQVSYNVIKAMLKLPLSYSESKTDSSSNTQSAEYYKLLKTMLTYFKPIIANYIKTENAQEECLRAIQDSAFSNQEFILPYVQNLLHFFYDNDILFEEKIIEWYEQDYKDNQNTSHDCGSDNDDDLKEEGKKNLAKAIRNAVASFIKWLKEAEEEDSSASS